MTSYSKDKLDELMDNLEESSDRMSDLIGVVEMIKDLKTKQDDLLTGFDVAKEEINEAAKDLGESKTEVIGAVERLRSGSVQLEKTATATSQRVTDSLAELQRKVDIRLKTTQDALDTGMGSVKSENRQYYTDLETLVRLKLDENKAEIKQFIEHERGQISAIIETRLQQAEARIRADTEKRTTQLLESQQTTRTALWTVAGVLICLMVVTIAKLFGLFD